MADGGEYEGGEYEGQYDEGQYDEGEYDGYDEGYDEYEEYEGEEGYEYEEGGEYEGGSYEYSSQGGGGEEENPLEFTCWAKALYDFDGQTEAELSFKAGDAIGIVDPNPANEWWFGKSYNTGAKGSFPQNYVDLGPDGLGASSPEYALEFGEEKEEQIEEAPSGNSQSHEVDEVQSRKQKLRDDMNELKGKLESLRNQKKELKSDVENLEEQKASLSQEIQSLEKVSNLDHIRYDMWKSILAVESEGKSLAKLELISQDLSSEMSTLRDIVGPVLTGVGVPLLEEYSKNFQKTLDEMRAKILEATKFQDASKQSRVEFLDAMIRAELTLEKVQQNSG